MNSASAARVKLWCWAASRNARSCRELKSTIDDYSTIVDYFEVISQVGPVVQSGRGSGTERLDPVRGPGRTVRSEQQALPRTSRRGVRLALPRGWRRRWID